MIKIVGSFSLLILFVLIGNTLPLHGLQVGMEGLIAHWPLDKDAADASGGGQNGTAIGVRFLPAGPGEPAAALFDGRANRIEFAAGPVLQLGTSDFSISLWLHTAQNLDDDLGELVSKFDAERRCGFSLTLRNNSVTSSQCNRRQLQFGIDDGTTPQWTDLGRPGNSMYGMALCVHDGRLFCGTCEPGVDQAGHVYRYDDGTSWTDLGSPDSSNAVVCAAAFQGKLHVGTGKYRLAGSALPESENLHLGGRVFRLEDDNRWTLVGELPGVEAVSSMVVYRGALYASSLYRPAGLFRYDGEAAWTAISTPDNKRPEALAVYNGYLWATCYDGAHVFRFDGTDWKDMGQLENNTQTYSFAIQQGQLHVGTWPSGKVYRLTADEKWHDTGRLGEELEVMGMALHNGKLYAGSLPLAEMFRYDGEQQWKSVGRLDTTPEVKYRRIWTCSQFQGRLLATTLPSGHIYAMEAGKCVTYDHELPSGWQHVTAVRDRDRLRIYVNGKQVAQSGPVVSSTFNLSNDKPLLIGAGAGDYFNGSLRDVRLYRRALTADEIASLAKTSSR